MLFLILFLFFSLTQSFIISHEPIVNQTFNDSQICYCKKQSFIDEFGSKLTPELWYCISDFVARIHVVDEAVVFQPKIPLKIYDIQVEHVYREKNNGSHALNQGTKYDFVLFC